MRVCQGVDGETALATTVTFYTLFGLWRVWVGIHWGLKALVTTFCNFNIRFRFVFQKSYFDFGQTETTGREEEQFCEQEIYV